MKHFILAKVHSCSPNDEPKDLEKGLAYSVILEATKRIKKEVVPDFISAKSKLSLEAGEHLLEIEMFNIGQPNGGRVQTYYRILRKVDPKDVKADSGAKK